jgi:hypothetical protein
MEKEYLKKCKCGDVAYTTADLDRFATDRTHKLGKKNMCKLCNKSKVKAWYDKDPERGRSFSKRANSKYRSKEDYKEKHYDYSLQKKYNITLKEYKHMFEKQDGKCKICGCMDKLVVDHNHDTGTVRGLLCNGCNSGIGFLQDSPTVIMKAYAYLLKETFYGK